MATTGLEVFDKTLHTTNLWLDEISEEIGPDRHLAWHVLGTVLRSIRDEMQVEQSAHFAAQLPLLVRGAYFDQYRPATQPATTRSHDDFVGRIRHDLEGSRRVNPERAAAAVMRTLNRHVSEGQIRKVRDALPKGVRAIWPEPDHAEVEAGPGPRRHTRSVDKPAAGSKDAAPMAQPAAASPPAPAPSAAPGRAGPQRSAQGSAQGRWDDIEAEAGEAEQAAARIARAAPPPGGTALPLTAAPANGKTKAPPPRGGRRKDG